MIVDERMITYINSLDTSNPSWLNEVERAAREDRVPVIRQEMQSFLRVFLELKQPEHILEIGTAVGFSALLMAEYTPSDCVITTIENYEKRILEARRNFAASPHRDRITLLEGDALELLKELEGSFDMIFMDAAKGQYIHFLPDVLRLLKRRGVLISDNVLQDGDIIESHYAVERRNRTIYKRMRDYLYVLKHTEGLQTCIVPIGDGAAVTIKTRDDVTLA